MALGQGGCVLKPGAKGGYQSLQQFTVIHCTMQVIR